MLSDVRILGQKEVTRFLDAGRSVTGIETRFNVGTDGPFSVFLADDAFTPAGNVALIEAKADLVRGTRAGLGT